MSEYPLRTLDIIAFVGIRDAERARTFYEGVLGLRLVSDELPFALVFDANGTMLRATMVGNAKPAGHTILGWKVSGIEVVVRKLGEAGVVFERYPGMGQDELGVWTAPGGAKVAWFKDPDGNVLSVSEHS